MIESPSIETSPLSFTVTLARSEDDLRAAARVRSEAYGHHVPALRHALEAPDALDRVPGVAVLLCRDKLTGKALGTARVVCSSAHRLQLEASVALPAPLRAQPRAEITRLAVLGGADPQVRLMLFKAGYLFCLATQTRWLVIGARSEALIRIYRRLGFVDVFGPDTLVPLAHAGDLPHRILAFDVVAAERTWLAAGHGLYPFMIETYHPDLRLFAGE